MIAFSLSPMVTRPILFFVNPWYVHLVLLISNPRSNLRRDSDLNLAFLFLILLINGRMSFFHSPNCAQRLFDSFSEWCHSSFNRLPGFNLFLFGFLRIRAILSISCALTFSLVVCPIVDDCLVPVAFVCVLPE